MLWAGIESNAVLRFAAAFFAFSEFSGWKSSRFGKTERVLGAATNFE
jgi:hypothetical protein